MEGLAEDCEKAPGEGCSGGAFEGECSEEESVSSSASSSLFRSEKSSYMKGSSTSVHQSSQWHKAHLLGLFVILAIRCSSNLLHCVCIIIIVARLLSQARCIA